MFFNFPQIRNKNKTLESIYAKHLYAKRARNNAARNQRSIGKI